jgi:hypothetical protein
MEGLPFIENSLSATRLLRALREVRPDEQVPALEYQQNADETLQFLSNHRHLQI